ncbi:ribonuclease P protein subunit p21 isoform X1 [Strigops habroptila]|uniref:ribonuclease P protein subunit p21 isoform X1 n=1 Tax=Strigops habroptila TaxID=2489341 RepID=UPI0011CF29D6|nr:ribonuclease P protein subunit p21 isoform X1 [Strigops habroptila]
MGSAGPAHPEGARPIGSAMAAPVKDREVLQRLSFLFQAAHWVLPHSPALARFYCSIQRGTARRLVLRLSGPAPHRAAVPELRPPPPVPLPGAPHPGDPPLGDPHFGAPPTGASPGPRGPPRINPAQQQSGDMSSDWSPQKRPVPNQKTPFAEIKLPLFHIWYRRCGRGWG